MSEPRSTTRPALAALAALGALLWSGPAAAQLANSPWPMMHHDLHHSARTTVVGPASPGNLKWTYAPGGYVKGSAIVGPDGTIYLAQQQIVHALHPADGTVKWNGQMQGIARRNTPAIDVGGHTYTGGRDNRLWAFNSDGTEEWAFTVGDDGDVNVSAAIAPNGTIYMAGTFSGLVHALRPNGTLIWKVPIGSVSYSSPAVGDDGTVYFGNIPGELVAIQSNGTIKWRKKVGRRIRFASPAIGPDGNIYLGSTPGLTAVKPDGTIAWTFTTAGFVDSTPAIASDGTIYFGSKGTVGQQGASLYAIHPNGTLAWRYQTDKAFVASPAVGGDGTIYTASGADVIAVDDTGHLVWSYPTPRPVTSSPCIGGDGTLYIASDKLYAFGR